MKHENEENCKKIYYKITYSSLVGLDSTTAWQIVSLHVTIMNYSPL